MTDAAAPSSQPKADEPRHAPTLKLSERDSEILHAEVRGSAAEFLGWLTGMKPPTDRESIPPEMRPAFNRMCQRLADAAVIVGESVMLNLVQENATLSSRVEELEKALRLSKAAMLKIRAASIAGCEEGYGKPDECEGMCGV